MVHRGRLAIRHARRGRRVAIVWAPSAPSLARWARSRLLRRNGRQRWRPAGASVVWSCRPAGAPGRSFWRWVLVSGNTGWPAWRAAWSRRVG
jgi:hypothetical protein